MFENFKEAVRVRVAPTGNHISALRQDLRSRLQGFRAQRTVAEQALLEQDFELVLHAWGIGDATLIPAVLRELRLRIGVFALPVASCVVLALFRPWPAAWLPLALIAPPCLLGVVTTLWRVSVLTRQQYQPFRHWLGRGLCSAVIFTKKGA